jgi:hypothetical protein
MKAGFIFGAPKLHNTLRCPQYGEDDYWLIVICSREFWIKISPFVFDQLYDWF